MNKIYKEFIKNALTSIYRRNIHNTANRGTPGAYEASGKTSVHVLNKEAELGLMIDGYSQVGFRLNNDLTIIGPMVIFPRSVLSWNVEHMSDITEEALSLFEIIEPKVDIIVLGIGDKTINFDIYQKILPFSRKHRIPFEILPTENACATFNFLNAEGRYVAGAMIPPKHITASEDDEHLTKIRYQNIYEGE
ncbi:hypothetical protein NQ315_015825 [Exocentrus adspersus]|uniref:NADH dehydrogenase [ubiquinone] 1 alpha subcomplex assembly factor 3 n=1 Tax=Exocentrus adspersus TaxID=1586481 RepID=A0AAV8W3X3_9CUCU|nr:hypothetical protein NQ315_015825 [Exocentrus adspersus]